MLTLSKSDFKLAQTCPAKLYYRKSKYPDNRNDDPYMAMLAEGGYMVEALAKAQRPTGIQPELTGNPVEDFRRTTELLKADNAVVFEATLLVGVRLARVDILVKQGTTLRLIEVKAKSFDSVAHEAELAAGKGGEFRASTKKRAIIKKWLPYLEDITYQVILAERAFPGCTVVPILLLADKTKVARADRIPTMFEMVRSTRPDGTQRLVTGRYIGADRTLDGMDLLTEIDVSAEVAELRGQVDAAAAQYEASLNPELKRLAPILRSSCRDCEFRHSDAVALDGFRECWGAMADVKPHILDLYYASYVKGESGRELTTELAASGDASLLSVPVDRLKTAKGEVGKRNERRLAQLDSCRTSRPWVSDGLAGVLSDVTYPLRFLDFETSRLALPYHSGMHPYGLIAFQWSCHTVDAPGAVPRHSEWLNQVDLWPNRAFAESLREEVGDTGTVLAWASHEKTTMRQIAAELAAEDQQSTALTWLNDKNTATRIIDLNAVTLAHYCHPAMGGRTSIKVVLDALWTDPEMCAQYTEWTGRTAPAGDGPYGSLPPILIQGVPQEVREGTGAMRAYQEMMYGESAGDEAARQQWARLLLQYCELDTMAMVLIWEHWRRFTVSMM